MGEKDHKLDYNQYPSEFEPDPTIYVLFATNGLTMGRIIAFSKSEYCKEHQDELVIFNANVLTKNRGKIWYGDLNITLDFDNLKNVADKLEEDLYILMEGDARFGKENLPIDELLPKAITIIRCVKTDVSEDNVKHTNKKNKKNKKS